ncbi:protein TSSC4 isoform X2 [Plectropomus leopardus]|uniref:protein TSSC4 isoform X2 n=1 Tax=Plectropomus leopardus TaxID=160734 RepID=UPI001C4CAEC1|nr:protein TSSC4 isoform X2 [Plectropomus leopardus]
MVIDLELLQPVKMSDQKNDHDEALNSDDVDELSASDDSEPEGGLSSAPFDPELDCDDDEDGREVAAPAAGRGAQSPFSLRGGSSAFSNRSHSIFDSLDSVPRLSPSSSLNQESDMDGVFARPLPPRPSRKTSQPPSDGPSPAKKRGVPDYLVHPERWTHYSLEDVAETSDQGNSRAALNFLSGLQQRKETQQESRSESSCDVLQKMIFSRPSGLQKEQPADHLTAVRGKEKETRLSHLDEEDEQEEGREGGRSREQSVEKDRKRDEDKDVRGAVGQPEEKTEVKEDKGERMEDTNTSFTSFRKTKRKNYRRSSEQDDN